MEATVTSRAFCVKAIRDEYEQETGERPSRLAADAIFDQRLDAFREKFAGAGAAYAVLDDAFCARYLANYWVGAEHGAAGKKLRAALKLLDSGDLAELHRMRAENV